MQYFKWGLGQTSLRDLMGFLIFYLFFFFLGGGGVGGCFHT